MIGNRWRMAPKILVATLFVLPACTVTDYEKPINDMASAVELSVTKIESIDEQMTAVRNEQLRKQIARGSALLTEAKDKCALGKSACTLVVVVRRNGGTKSESFPVASIIPKARAGLEGLRSYVKYLREITTADTVNKVTASANNALGSLANIEKAILTEGDKPTGTIGSFRQSGTDLVNWIVGQYVDFVKARALRKATSEAQPVVEKLAKFYDAIGDAAAQYDLGGAHRAFIAAQQNFDQAGRTPNETAINAYVDAARSYDRALRAGAARPLRAFAEAHGKLAKHLNGEDVSLVEALAAIENLVARANAFKIIVERLKADIDASKRRTQ